jgi:hypothetical protein
MRSEKMNYNDKEAIEFCHNQKTFHANMTDHKQIQFVTLVWQKFKCSEKEATDLVYEAMDQLIPE